MKQFVTVAALLATAMAGGLYNSAPGHADGEMEISRDATRPENGGSPDFFTGEVVVKPLFDANDYRNTSAGQVTFSPCARSAWHTHPAGQTLIVTTGTGWVQQWGQQKQEIGPGDVIWTPPGVKHWHGATATEAMTHYALQGAVDGLNVDWMEKVSDDQYFN